jgi:hypothetical protein
MVFLIIEFLIYAFYRANTIRCEPCLPGTYCPPCISTEQVISLWAGLVLAGIFLIWQLIRVIRSKGKTK